MASNFWKKHENLYFAVTNKKVIFGVSLFLLIILLGLIGPYFTSYGYEDFGEAYLPPSAEHFFGTNIMGQDVYTRTVLGLRSTIAVGLMAGTIATIIGCIIGFVAGYFGGKFLDEFLMMITNVFITFPSLVLLIIISAILQVRGITIMAVIVSVTAWPWTARAVRSQALSLRNEEYVNLSRISSLKLSRILREDIAANMFSYVFMVYILQFNGTILAAVGLEFLGLGPTQGVSLGLVMQNAVNWNAIQLDMWWWAIIPGLILTLMVTSLYFINTGMDEVFNPRLREM